MTTAVEVRGLAKRYHRVEALRGIDFEVPTGSICGFLGPNGAGKTTTMEILMGSIRSTGGWASLLGEDLGASVHARIGYLPQDPAFFPRTSVRNVLRFVARRFWTAPSASIEAKVDETLNLVGLEELESRKVKSLSGGELQRLGIGQAVIGDPKLLILDEPSVGLDPEGRAAILRLLERLKQRMTIFYSSHVLDDVERVADHIVVIDRGEVVEQGPMARYLSRGAAYSVSMVGDGAAATMETLANEPWVTNVLPIRDGEWEIYSNDKSAAEQHVLQSLVTSNGSRVVSLRPMQRSLEDLYVDLVGVNDDD
jgi:ABC-2 type transport system ATP-binding protein